MIENLESEMNVLSQMLKKAQEGDTQSYQQFLYAITPLVKSLVAKKIRDHGHREDVYQDSILSIHHYLASYDPTRDAIPWVVTITKRRICDFYQNRWSQFSKETSLDDSDVTFHQFNPNYDEESDCDEILSALPAGLYRPIYLTKVEGMSTKEAAKMLGIQENALRTRVSRGLKILRETFFVKKDHDHEK